MNKSAISNEPYQSFGGHGVDVAIKRADDLDKASLEYFVSKGNTRVLDLGCGAGGHSVRMAKAGVRVMALDKYNFSNEFTAQKKLESIPDTHLNFICGDITNLTHLIGVNNFTGIYMQRVLHYLTYQEALKLLIELHKISEDRLYISVTGLMSGVGDDYLDKDVEIEKRFVSLNPKQAKTYSIDEPICLYSNKEFTSLLTTAGWKVERCWESAFGNLKAVCVH